MPSIKITPLGAGQDVGRSCIIVTIGGKRIMLDCGMHMCFTDSRKYPDFSYLTNTGNLNDFIDLVLISHFHLDHCGALPYMTEQVGYDGPILMSTPTKAISKILIEDMARIMSEKKAELDLVSAQMIRDCFDKVTEISLHEVVEINGIKVKAYYAGHVLGAVMFHVTVGEKSVVYTGDFNTTSDSHLGGAWIDRCEPDVLITESTYGTTIRESRKCRENDLLVKVHQIIENGGKVLIPVFALGRAQEICLLLERFWDRKNIKVPLYMSTGMAEKAVNYYKLYINWTNQTIKNSFYQRNFFQFKHVQPFEKSLIDSPGPMVVLASPGMLHAGLSCHIFKKWAHDPMNAVIMAGYCAIGTLGNKVLSGQKRIEITDHLGTHMLEVKIQVLNMSFSAHADSVGIMQLIDYCRPKKAVILVHGDAEVMKTIQPAIASEFNLECYCPENGQNLVIDVDNDPVKALMLKDEIPRFDMATNSRFHGYLSVENSKNYPYRVNVINKHKSYNPLVVSTSLDMNVRSSQISSSITKTEILEKIKVNITRNHPGVLIFNMHEFAFSIYSVVVEISEGVSNTRSSDLVSYNFQISWTILDQDVADSILKLIQHTFDQIQT